MTRFTRLALILITLLAFTGTLYAQVEPQKDSLVAEKVVRHPDLDIAAINAQLGELPSTAAAEAQQRLARLDVNPATARVDGRSGRFSTLLPTTPLVPGKGVGNSLKWADLKVGDSRVLREKAAGDAFMAYLRANQADLRINPSELTNYRVVSHGEDLYQIHADRTIHGIPVRDNNITAVIGQGNLTLFGTHQWGDTPAQAKRAELSVEQARAAAEGHLAPLTVIGEWADAKRVYVPMANGDSYRYQLVWAVNLNIDGDAGSWELLVDAYDGSILANEDQNHYADARGGVYPVTNDGVVPDGVEQPNDPMPWMNVGSATTDTGGNYNLSGSQTATFYGPYVNMADNCGTDSLTQSGGINWGSSGGTDCTTPGFGGAGNTHSSRSGFYELNKLKEMARGQLPSNSWLQGRLTANMNINNTCNAYWNGSTVNFYRSGGGCSNTGEIAAVFDHEWGHGMDANDVKGGIASPSGEGIADMYSSLRLNDSCIGRNFRSTVCSGNGDPCLTCTGVRDIDYLKRASGQPHDYTWSNANCGTSVHCKGGVYSEAMWSLWKRKLQSAPYNYDNNTAYEVVTRMTYIAAGNTTTWFSGGPPYGGCASSSGYLNYLAADDDNGNINDGTPHMTAIFESFNDQEIACNTPTVQDSGCAGTPTAAPSVSSTTGDTSVSLSWGSVSGASNYEVYRTEGVFQCNFGKVKLGSTTGTSWNDSGLQNGREYSYVVIPKGSNAACFGPASACENATPVGTTCSVDADCDDGLFCNGVETCSFGACLGGSAPCGANETCNETTDTCDPIVCFPAGQSCTSNADCCSNTCKGKPGAQTCK